MSKMQLGSIFRKIFKVLAVFVLLQLIVTTVVIAADYVGPNKCKMCHMKQYKSWKKMKHADNFELLKGDKRKNPECVKCHSVGFGKGGFVNEETTPDLKNVSCEACHGPGGDHIKAAKAKKKETISRKLKNACISCHNPHTKRNDS